MKKITFFVAMSLVGATKSYTKEYPDDATPEDIEEDLETWANEQVDVWWEEES